MKAEIISKRKKYSLKKDKDSLEKVIGKLLISKKLTLSVAESCTGGLISKRLTDVPGSSKYIKLNAITYSNKAKNLLLKVPETLLKKYGAVSSQVAAKMAAGIKELSDTDIGLSVTGIAGPDGGSENKPIGLVYFGLAKGKKVKTKKVYFGSNSSREEIRWLASQFALNWLRQELIKK
ncbi:MAG: hypothetical protein A3B68_06860 [Candidatus Melainabacteria bacterium RIFCSPHIGHO2_02_FULL_34_12]|nr:MAG: hypothetical protein A3B68_06860 [Candidatus Melainabacteria bacterium RIFCSPHIGHO2_02_FULL_34_12]